MSNDWKHTAVHVAHHVLQTEMGKQAVKTMVTTLATVGPPALVVAGTAATAIALPAAVIGGVSYGLYRLFKR